MLRYSDHTLINLFLLTFWLSVVSCQDKRYHAETTRVNLDTVPEHLQAVYEWQRNKNEYFLDPSTSPLRSKEKKRFDGLDFFTPTSDYKVKALFREAFKKDTIQMKTTTGSVTNEIVYGNLFFEINNRSHVLPVYRE